MLTIYFKSPFTLERMRSGPSGPYLDGFAHKLHLAGYLRAAAQRLLRGISGTSYSPSVKRKIKNFLFYIISMT
jgi:hypothetical protein